jgi:hypothetical protein
MELADSLGVCRNPALIRIIKQANLVPNFPLYIFKTCFNNILLSRPAMTNWRPAASFTLAPTKAQVYFQKILTSQL